jgi:hypothetical protein
MSTSRAPEKPPHGAPCNGCGLCCAAEPCALAGEYLGQAPDEGPCRALEFDDGRFWCGLVQRPGYYLGLQDWADPQFAVLFAFALRLGLGCDAEDE